MDACESLLEDRDYLRAKCEELQRRCDSLESISRAPPNVDQEKEGAKLSSDDNLKQLAVKISQLYDKNLYSDLTIHADGYEIKAHRLVVANRTDAWGDLLNVDRIDLEGVNYPTAKTLVKWIYTDAIDSELGDAYILSLLEASAKFNLAALRQRCGTMLIDRLWTTLLAGQFESARLLLDAGANVNEQRRNTPLLLRAIEAKRNDVARFLLDNKAIAAVTTTDGFSCLSLAVRNGLTPTVDYLCRLGANLDHPHPLTGLPPLWTALENGDYATAATLVRRGCDCEGWALNEDVELEETMLHRAIDRHNQQAAVFLIDSGCNVNALRRLPALSLNRCGGKSAKNSPKNGNGNEANAAIYQTPLHASVQWGQSEVIGRLLVHPSCKVDAQDYDGRTAAHLAIVEQDAATLDRLLALPDPAVFNVKDRYGYTPLATAIKYRNHKAADAICRRIPYAALQINGSGENLLHTSVKSNDLESVLFLLGLQQRMQERIQMDVKIPVQDQDCLTALHICAEVGNNLILRNLLLVGAEVNTTSTRRQTALHLAAARDHADICGILLENGANPNIIDVDGNNALHLAVANGAVNAVQILLLDSDVDYLATNKKQQNVMHLCAIHCVGLTSTEMFVTILEAYPKFPLEAVDMYGNTMFLLSFLNANSELCRLALRRGACLATTNQRGQSVFNIDTPTHQLLFGLLEGLDREPRWAEGDQCSECETKFTLTMRKHHCRHCGRLVCAKCSERQVPLPKFKVSKSVRVCQICFDVLTRGDDNHGTIDDYGKSTVGSQRQTDNNGFGHAYA